VNSATLDPQSAARPLAPRAGIELGLDAGALEGENGHGGRDSGAAVHGDLGIGVDRGRFLRVRHVHGARDMAGDRIDRLDLAPIALRRTCVHKDEARLPEALLDLLGRHDVVIARLRTEVGRLDVLLAGTERPEPVVQSSAQDGSVVVPEMAEEPPEPRGAAVHFLVVGDDERVVSDPGRSGRAGEVFRSRKGVPPSVATSGRRRKLRLDVQKERAGNVAAQIERTPDLRMPELPPAIDELHPHGAGD
jgi:hypothetical protein